MVPQYQSLIPLLAKNLEPELISLSLDIHARPETAWNEHYAVSRLCGLLNKYGISTEHPFMGLDTSFRATLEFGAGGADISILAEYDALPELGHACSHNIIGAAAVGAVILLKQSLEGKLHSGRVHVIGCPAEEGGGGKLILLQRGAFANTDAAMMIHGGTKNMVTRGSLALCDLKFKFYGKASHAASNPHLGINALDACIHTFNAVNSMRQHFPDETRVHGIITSGGSAANVVPEYAEAKFLVRHKNLHTMRQIKDQVILCAKGAAMSVGATMEAEENREYTPRNNNLTLANCFGQHLVALGEELQEPPQVGGVGSSDFNNVSFAVPAIHPYLKIAPEGISAHTKEFALASKSLEGMHALLIGAQAMALTTAELLTNPELLSQVKSEFLLSKGNV